MHEKVCKEDIFLQRYNKKSELFSKQTAERQGSLLKGTSTLKSDRSGFKSRWISEGPPLP